MSLTPSRLKPLEYKPKHSWETPPSKPTPMPALMPKMLLEPMPSKSSPPPPSRVPSYKLTSTLPESSGWRIAQLQPWQHSLQPLRMLNLLQPRLRLLRPDLVLPRRHARLLLSRSPWMHSLKTLQRRQRDRRLPKTLLRNTMLPLNSQPLQVPKVPSVTCLNPWMVSPHQADFQDH